MRNAVKKNERNIESKHISFYLILSTHVAVRSGSGCTAFFIMLIWNGTGLPLIGAKTTCAAKSTYISFGIRSLGYSLVELHRKYKIFHQVSVTLELGTGWTEMCSARPHWAEMQNQLDCRIQLLPGIVWLLIFVASVLLVFPHVRDFFFQFCRWWRVPAVGYWGWRRRSPPETRNLRM